MPTSLTLTSRNGRVGKVGIGKRVDRFFMAKGLADMVGRHKSWTINLGISNHLPVCLQLEVRISNLHYPFKFNHIWLEDHDFKKMVRDFWGPCSGYLEDSTMQRMVKKLTDMKKVVVGWEMEKNNNTETYELHNWVIVGLCD